MIRHILFLLFSLCSSAHSSVMVITKEKQSATVGGKVTLKCMLQASHPNIFQITWHKETGNFTGPVATSSKVYGQRILGYFTNRTAQYTVDTFNVSAITISSVTLEDQGCFKCIFNVYPIGANSGTVCLNVYERNISEPILEKHQVRSQDSSEKLQVVTCSVTGKPAPQISWNTTAGLTITPQMYTIKNPNGTETTISNFTQKVTQKLGEKVICVVSHPTLHSDIYLSTFLDDTELEEYSMDPFLQSLCAIIIFIIIIVSFFTLIWKLQESKKKHWCSTSRIEECESSTKSNEEALISNSQHQTYRTASNPQCTNNLIHLFV